MILMFRVTHMQKAFQIFTRILFIFLGYRNIFMESLHQNPPFYKITHAGPIAFLAWLNKKSIFTHHFLENLKNLDFIVFAPT